MFSNETIAVRITVSFLSYYLTPFFIPMLLQLRPIYNWVPFQQEPPVYNRQTIGLIFWLCSLPQSSVSMSLWLNVIVLKLQTNEKNLSSLCFIQYIRITTPIRLFALSTCSRESQFHCKTISNRILFCEITINLTLYTYRCSRIFKCKKNVIGTKQFSSKFLTLRL